MKRTLRQLAVSVWLASSVAFAQDATPKSGVVTTTTSGSNYILEYGMVIVMFGAALFAVCRSSRRNV